MVFEIHYLLWIAFLTSSPTIPERERYQLATKANPENQLVLTAASSVQKYRVRLVLCQFEDMRIRGHPGKT